MKDALAPLEVSRLYERYGYFLLRRCRTILRETVAADDALQLVFEKLLRNGGAVRHVDQPLRWLYRVADRCCFDMLRGRRRRRESPVDVETMTHAHGAHATHPAVEIELRDAALYLLSRMDEQDQQMAVFLFVDGMSQEAIAEELGLSRVTVNKRVQALRARAREAISSGPEET